MVAETNAGPGPGPLKTSHPQFPGTATVSA